VIIFIYGTTAEAIKIAPVARRLEARGIPYESWVTFQHTDALRAILPELGLQEPTRMIANGRGGKPLKSSADVLAWLTSIAGWIRKNKRNVRGSLPSNTVVVVHGDTLTTVIGAYIAKKLKVPSAHIEAGLRSGNWRHPFPEELDRRIAGKLAAIHYAPSAEAATNLAAKHDVVFTNGNTVIDAVLDQGGDALLDQAPFGLVLLHRFEFVSNPQLVEETMRTLVEKSPVPLRLIVDAYSEHGMTGALAKHVGDKLQPQPKLRHQEFVGLLKTTEFIVTDSGGIQAEAALLGIPTLVHRKTTEQREGIGENIVLSNWSQTTLANFLHDYESYRLSARKPSRSPSDIIVEDLLARGYGS
jgi:UDP-N-acetylglucosamine 2-epimerase (non-hydrolysing)